MLLRDLIARANELSWHDWVYVERGALTPDTPAVVTPTPPPREDTDPNMTALLAVHELQDILQAWSNFRDGRKPTVDQALRAIRYWEENDAFIPGTIDP